MRGEHAAQVGLELRFVLGHQALLEREIVAHFGANRIHQASAVRRGHQGLGAGHVMFAAQVDAVRHFRHLGFKQRRDGIQPFLRRREPCSEPQLLQLRNDAVLNHCIRFEKALVAGQQVTALASLGILQCRQQGDPAVDQRRRMLANARGVLDLPERPQRRRPSQADQQDRGNQPGANLISDFHERYSFWR